MKITTTPRPPPPKNQNISTRLSFIFSRTGSVSRALEYRGGGGGGGGGEEKRGGGGGGGGGVT